MSNSDNQSKIRILSRAEVVVNRLTKQREEAVQIADAKFIEAIATCTTYIPNSKHGEWIDIHNDHPSCTALFPTEMSQKMKNRIPEFIQDGRDDGFIVALANGGITYYVNMKKDD